MTTALCLVIAVAFIILICFAIHFHAEARTEYHRGNAWQLCCSERDQTIAQLEHKIKLRDTVIDQLQKKLSHVRHSIDAAN